MFGFFGSNNNNNKQAPATKKAALDEEDFEEIAPKTSKPTTKDSRPLDNEMTTSIADWQTIESSVIITKATPTLSTSPSQINPPVVIQTQKIEVKIEATKQIPAQPTVETKVNSVNNNNSVTESKPIYIHIAAAPAKESVVIAKEPVVEVPVKESIVPEKEEEEPEWKKQLASRDKTPYAYPTPSPPYATNTHKNPSYVETTTTTISYTQTQSTTKPYAVPSSSSNNAPYAVAASGVEYASPQSNKHDAPYSIAY
eukprot:TRINITY_DN3414_c0_g1_i1.p1 TRINITY_DN3414_c0_g1~~TRINITY_DN3414_c0_g1_i1.p1  ORF type:complete len:255 (-),score=78.48 TRINITY_DN3414_c0_g1_i1:273-1037(-)